MKRLLVLFVLVLLGYGVSQWSQTAPDTAGTAAARSSGEAASASTGDSDRRAVTASGADRLRLAFENRESNLQVEGQGTVVKVLRDDTNGSPHQRFLLRTSTGQTLLVAHNIELAPRIVDIAEGDTVRFYGEYEWNEKGGVIHWTHHDPRGKHPGGWLEHRGQRYE